ncbi:MAG: hypothetical protein ACXWPM_12595 [Bdellovibrionota bacterium]
MNARKILLVLGFTGLVSANAMAAESIRCTDVYLGKEGVTLTADIASDTELANVVESQDGRETSRRDSMSGEENPRTRKYQGYLYFFYRGHSGDAIVLPSDFASQRTFRGNIIIQNDERGGGTTRLRCEKL